MKKITLLLCMLLSALLLVGCAGTPVIYHMDCDCPVENTNTPSNSVPEIVVTEGALKTGLALVTGVGDSINASEEKDGEAKYDVTMVAVLVDEKGVIADCIIDGISTSVKFDADGHVITNLENAPQTKNELGADYGMVAYGGAKAEWDEQAQALADFAKGKTTKELVEGAVDETGKAPKGTDLASSATIYLGSYVSAIEKAVENAAHLGAQSGDTLKMATISTAASSTDATAEKAGNAQLDSTVAVLTMNEEVITSCIIDSVQAKVAFDITGTIASDTSAPVKTKNELGEKYGMVAWGGAIAEWDEQAAAFSSYVTGKTPSQVSDISVNEKTAPTETDLASSVTIAIGDFMTLVEKAAK